MSFDVSSDSAVRTGLHWYRFSSRRAWEDVADLVPGSWADPEWRGGFNQPRSVVHESGARLYFGSEKAQQPVVVNCPGEVCERFADEAVAWSSAAEGRVSRFDVAVDLAPAEQARRRMVEMRRAWKADKVKTRVRSFEERRSDTGWTWYFGDRQSNLFLRVYDRRAIEDPEHGALRLEFEVKPDREDGVRVPTLLQSHTMASVWRGFAHQIIFPLGWYKDLLKGSTASWEPATLRENEFAKVLEQFRVQFGATLWALQLMGVKLGDGVDLATGEISKSDLVREPGQLHGQLVAKLLRWADECEVLGYDGEDLRREVQCKLKQKRG